MIKKIERYKNLYISFFPSMNMIKRTETTNTFPFANSIFIHIFLSVAFQTDESLKSQSAALGSIFLYHIYTESNNNNHKKEQI